MKRSRTFVSKVIGLLLLIIFCWSGLYLFQYGVDEYQIYELEQELDEEKKEVISEETGELDAGELKELHSGSVGWITIEGTAIDYPFLQAEDNSYYLDHDCNNHSSVQGSIFLDYRIKKDIEDKHIILYGHNMKDGTMFHDLNMYKEESFLKEHKYVNIYDPDNYTIWEIFSTYSTDPGFDYLQTKFESDEEYLSFINQLVSKSDFSYKGKPFSAKERLLTLSTCSMDLDGGRRVVHARLKDKKTFVQ